MCQVILDSEIGKGLEDGSQHPLLVQTAGPKTQACGELQLRGINNMGLLYRDDIGSTYKDYLGLSRGLYRV